MITITKEIEEMIKKGEGKFTNLLIFKRLTDGTLYPLYVKEGENAEEIIKKFTSDIIHMGINIGPSFELVYNHKYAERPISVIKIPYEKLYEIKKGTFGYIDLEGNFYPIGDIDKHNEDYRYENNAGKIASNIVLSLNIPEEEKEKIKVKNQNYMEKRFSRYYWPAHNILEEKGFCLFFRGINYEECYDDQSSYDKANEKQLVVLSYLYTLNYIQDTDIEEKRKKLIRKLINNEEK